MRPKKFVILEFIEKLYTIEKFYIIFLLSIFICILFIWIIFFQKKMDRREFSSVEINGKWSGTVISEHVLLPKEIDEELIDYFYEPLEEVNSLQINLDLQESGDGEGNIEGFALYGITDGSPLSVTYKQGSIRMEFGNENIKTVFKGVLLYQSGSYVLKGNWENDIHLDQEFDYTYKGKWILKKER